MERPDFPTWLKELRRDAIHFGISQKLVDEALPDTLKLDERVEKLDKKQPEHKITFEEYKRNVINSKRVEDGRARMRQYKTLLQEISGVYGVEPQYIIALWGIETSYGKNVGGFETIPALVTMAYEGRRGDFFRGELLKALKIVDQGHIPLHAMKGSWAGAMGQCQFMPTSFEKYAQDYNKDGKWDIWNTEADVFASAANYLHMNGWKKGQPWAQPVKLPKNFDNKLIGRETQKSLQFWREAGVQFPDGKNLPEGSEDLASIIQPGGDGYKTYIIYGNYRALMKWNASTYFATAVGFLADELVK